MKKARKLKSTIVVRHRGEWREVEEVRTWGKNWLVKTAEPDFVEFVVSSTYRGLFRVSPKERTALLE